METIAAARATVELEYDGTDITADIEPFLQSFEYTDFGADQVDDIQVTLADPDGRWRGSWYPEKGATLRAGIRWSEGAVSRKLDCGTFVVDTPEYGGPPDAITLKATSASISTSMRRQARARQWKGVTLGQLVQKIGTEHGTTIKLSGPDTPTLVKIEQKRESDLAFLTRICGREGYALKVESNRIIIYRRATIDAQTPALTIRRGSDNIVSYRFADDRVNTYAACQVKYQHPGKGLLTATYTDPNADSQNGQTLQVSEHCGNQAEAIRRARAKLELANRGRRTCEMQLQGDVRLMSGITLTLTGFGVNDGRYTVDEARHAVDSGYKTTLKLVRVG